MPEGYEQLTFFDLEQVVALSALHHYICPTNEPEFLHLRLFNPSKPIPQRDEFVSHFKCEVIDFPETPPIEDWAA